MAESSQWRKINSCTGFGLLTTACLGHNSASVAACGGKNREVYLFQADDPVCRTTLHGLPSALSSLSFDPNEIVLVAGGECGSIRLWDLGAQGKPIRAVRAHLRGVSCVRFREDCQTYATCSMDASVKLWDVRSRDQTRCFRNHRDTVTSASFSPDGQLLATGDASGAFQIVNLSGEVLIDSSETGAPPHKLFEGDPSVEKTGKALIGISFCHQTFSVATISASYLQLWDLTRLKRVSTVKLASYPKWVHYVDQSHVLVATKLGIAVFTVAKSRLGKESASFAIPWTPGPSDCTPIADSSVLRAACVKGPNFDIFAADFESLLTTRSGSPARPLQYNTHVSVSEASQALNDPKPMKSPKKAAVSPSKVSSAGSDMNGKIHSSSHSSPRVAKNLRGDVAVCKAPPESMSPNSRENTAEDQVSNGKAVGDHATVDITTVVETPTKAPTSSSWNCEHCTFENAADKSICEICCKTSPSRRTSPAKQAEQKVNLPSANIRAKEGEREKLASSPTGSAVLQSAFSKASFGLGLENSAQSAETALLRSVFTDHRAVYHVLNQRRRALEEIAVVWKQGDTIGALKTVEISPTDVQVDFLTFSSHQFCSNSKRNELLSMGAAAVIAPLCANILAKDSKKEGVANLCIRYCHAILNAFDQRLVVAVKNGVLKNAFPDDQGGFVPGVAIAQPQKRDAECVKILSALLRISTLLDAIGPSEPGGKGGQLSAIAGSGAGSGNAGGQVAEVFARIQGVLRASP